MSLDEGLVDIIISEFSVAPLCDFFVFLSSTEKKDALLFFGPSLEHKNHPTDSFNICHVIILEIYIFASPFLVLQLQFKLSQSFTLI